MIYAHNPSFGFIFLAPEPPKLTFTTAYITTTGSNQAGKLVTASIHISDLGLDTSTALKAPFSLRIILLDDDFTTDIASLKQITPADKNALNITFKSISDNIFEVVFHEDANL